MLLFKKDDLKDSKKEVFTAVLSDSLEGHQISGDALEIYQDVISEVLHARGIDARQAYKADAGLWIIPAQPAPVVLRLKQGNEEDDTLDYIEVVMRLGPLPAQNLLAFYRALLEANLRLTNAAFSLSSDGIFLRHQRLLAGLDEDELDDIISSIMNGATDEFSPLIEQFVFGASILR